MEPQQFFCWVERSWVVRRCAVLEPQMQKKVVNIEREQHNLTLSKEVQEYMTFKVININQSEKTLQMNLKVFGQYWTTVKDFML